MIRYLKGGVSKKDFPDCQREIVLVGRSNAGKSSLINALFNQGIAKTGKTPGKTRILQFFEVKEGSLIVDAPGYGFAKRGQDELISFGNMMDDFFINNKSLKLCLMIVDCRHKPTKDDVDMIDYLKENHVNYLVVANKSDKLSNNQLFNSRKLISETLNIDPDRIIATSTLKKTNISKLKDIIDKYL